MKGIKIAVLVQKLRLQPAQQACLDFFYIKINLFPSKTQASVQSSVYSAHVDTSAGQTGCQSSVRGLEHARTSLMERRQMFACTKIKQSSYIKAFKKIYTKGQGKTFLLLLQKLSIKTGHYLYTDAHSFVFSNAVPTHINSYIIFSDLLHTLFYYI